MSDSLQLEQMQEGSVVYEPSESIYDAAQLCSKDFERQLGAADGVVEDNYREIKELWGRFNDWAAYVGAFVVPRASLNARLAPHAKIKDMVLELLDMIQENLEWVNIPNDEEEIDEFSLGLPAIKAALDRHVVLSENIRRSARHGHGSTQKSRKNQDESMCFLLVQRRFPLARKSLCSQLGASIHARGISLQYMHEHNKRLARRRNDKDDLETIEERSEGEITAPAVSSMNKDMAPREETVAQRTEVLHSAVSPSAVNRIKRNTRYPSSTVIARGSTVRDGQLDEYDYPSKPRQKIVERHQSCTICAMPLNLPTLTDSAWETHVDQDLEPYVCISEDCTDPLQFFTSLRSWMDRMKTQHSIDWSKQIHTGRWFCDVNHKEGLPEFDTIAEFLHHLNTYHGDKLSQSRIMGRLRRNRRIVIRDNSFACPLCNSIVSDERCGTAKAYDCLWKHIAQRLKSPAFLSLSYMDEDLEDRESVTGFSDRASN